jgi:redox-sensing transcriptional repressor
LSGYRGFEQQGFRLVGAFDSDRSKIGTKLGKLTIRPLEEIDDLVQSEEVELAIVSVPANAAVSVTQRLEIAGITGILNFAPVTVNKPQSSTTIVNVDLAVELQRLAFAVQKSKE